MDIPVRNAVNKGWEDWKELSSSSNSCWYELATKLVSGRFSLSGYSCRGGKRFVFHGCTKRADQIELTPLKINMSPQKGTISKEHGIFQIPSSNFSGDMLVLRVITPCFTTCLPLHQTGPPRREENRKRTASDELVGGFNPFETY